MEAQFAHILLTPGFVPPTKLLKIHAIPMSRLLMKMFKISILVSTPGYTTSVRPPIGLHTADHIL